MNHRISQQRAYDFLLAGKAQFTLHNIKPRKKSEDQFTYTIKQKSPGIWWVYTSTVYIGFLRGDVFVRKNQPEGQFAPHIEKSIEVFTWFWKALIAQRIPYNIHILNVGQCGYCGKKLTDAVSIEYGIGPQCRKKLGITVKKEETV